MNQGKATKKPVTIDWFEFSNKTLIELRSWIEGFGDNVSLIFEWGDEIKVKTLEGTSYNVPEGYIIIRGVEGEYYPCEPKIFEKTYNINK